MWVNIICFRNVHPETLIASRNISDWARCDSRCLLMDYRSNEQLNKDLLEMADMFSNIAMPFVIGLSSRQSPLVGIRISGNVRRGQDTLKPMVRLVSNLAGDETTGRELLTHFALHLLHQYNKDPLVTALLDTTDIAILPTLNPDGFEESRKGSCSGARNNRGRLNANNVELIKSFPTFEEKEKFENDVQFDPYSDR